MTRKQHLKKLPLQKRLQAMENIRRNYSFVSFEDRLNYCCSNDKNLLYGCFVFMDTRQGHNYWWNIQQKYFG